MYSLEEFKRWLKENPRKRANLAWSGLFVNRVKNDDDLEKLIKREDISRTSFSAPRWDKYRAVVSEWETERAKWKEFNANLY